ncbi:hypothetical protein NL676_002165 [Syzygium grande]|nr:hypothetical protein NL676_002165 [Syzygium grande]
MAFLLPLRGSSSVGALSRDGPVSPVDASALLPSSRRNWRAPIGLFGGRSSVRSFHVERRQGSFWIQQEGRSIDWTWESRFLALALKVDWSLLELILYKQGMLSS